MKKLEKAGVAKLLKLNKETLSRLEESALRQVAGGESMASWCPQTLKGCCYLN
jgi:hypothetical protein